MKVVHFLYHIDDLRSDGLYHHGKLAGIFSTVERAREAIRALRDKPGFRDYPERWRIYRRTVDRDSWTEGFVKETHEKIPKNA